MEVDPRDGTGRAHEFVENRGAPRYKIEVGLRVYARNSPVIRGHTVDLSRSGISAMLRVEVRLNEVVRLEVSLPAGEVEILAVVRQRSAFRYGFHFLGDQSGHGLIRQTLRELAMKQPAGNGQA